jgi:hypothetical protein
VFGVISAKITTRVKGYPPLISTVTRIEPPMLWTGVAKRAENEGYLADRTIPPF